MNNLSIISLFILSIFFTACGRNNQVNSSEHEQVTQASEQIRSLLEDIDDEFENLEKAQGEMEKVLAGLAEPSPDFANLVKRHASEIARMEGELEKVETVLDLHKNWEKEHEAKALSTEEIEAQHNQMRSDQAATSQILGNIKSNIQRIKAEQKSQAMAG